MTSDNKILLPGGLTIMKREVDIRDYAGRIMTAVEKGVLMTTAADGEVNTMVIGWGHLGTIWYKPTFVAYVRESRYTKALLEKNGEFTVNIPLGQADKKILSVCGTKSGRDMDKIKELGLTVEPGMTVAVPGIKELPLTLECKVHCSSIQNIPMLPEEILSRYYPQGVDSSNPGRNEDFHVAYYGEIVNAYLITD
jgi:flavin reductase (DIM6/NTAB) family NADH-FMN oxidoreductase RutF